MLGLSLGLGLNLASSLKRYAVILRWYLLTRRYVSLEVFDLILGLETLTKVGKLMVISLPGIGRNGPLKFLRRFPWFREGRDDGTRFTWIACMLWILVNIGAQVLVAALSLFWPVDPSSLPLQTWGNVTVANLTTWSADIPSEERWRNISSMHAAWLHGMEAMRYPTIDLDGRQVEDLNSLELESLSGTPLYKGDSFYEYRFYNRDPEHQFTSYVMSSRSIQARATCRELTVNGDIQGDNKNGMHIEVLKDEGRKLPKFLISAWSNGSLSWTASQNESCGPRCTGVTVVQNRDNYTIARTSVFICNSTLSKINASSEEFINLSPQDKEALHSNDAFARIAAGSIAWTGSKTRSDRQSQSYLGGSKWSPYEEVNKTTIEDLLSRFTIGAIAAFDDHGIRRYNLTNQPSRPTQGQQLQVDWPYVLGLMGGICLIQLVALIGLLAWGNKSIIRDESFFSLAMLLSPVVNRVGTHGMNLTGKELKQHPKLLWKRIKYDYTQGKDGEPNKVDVVFLGRGEYEVKRGWAPGIYT
ncbi:hypothetical protein CC80DRAFT_413608 [Byssothecium circinans]|uniref:Uncharacterized protein n=1 Tax=Byssothecium circinans TaxID=147558 RepID=A0A6A5TWY6_9PLEO|nr:hypothetical protein CC80DRAFT_413608 [Byssothecium circinans]